MAKEISELERKVKAIDRINRRINAVLDRKPLDGDVRAVQFHNMFVKTLATWGVTEDEYLEVSLKQTQ